MIALLIIFLIFIVLLAFFIGNNLSNVCTFWFFHTYTDMPVLVLVFFSFAAGIIISILFMIIGKILKMNKDAKTEKMEESDSKENKKSEKIKSKIKLGRKERESKDNASAVIVNAENTDNSTDE